MSLLHWSVTRSPTLKPLVFGELLPIEQAIEPTVIEPSSIALIGPAAAAALAVTFDSAEEVLVLVLTLADEVETDPLPDD